MKKIIKIWDKTLKFFGVTRNSIYKKDMELLKKDISILKEKVGDLSSVKKYDVVSMLGKELPPKHIQPEQKTKTSLFNKKVKVSQKDKIYRLSIQVSEGLIITSNLKQNELNQLYIDIEELIK